MFATIAGFYPFGAPPGVSASFERARADRERGAITEEAFTAAADAWVTEIVAEQASAGLSMLDEGWARWRAGSPADLARDLLAGSLTPAMLVGAWRWADDGIDAMVKQVLPGPWSAARAIAGAGAPSRERRAVARDLVDALAEAGRALRDSMVPVLQFDEPAVPGIGDDDAAWDELCELHEQLAGLVPGIHRMLAIGGGAAHPAGHARLAALPFQSLLVDVVGGGADGWRLIHALPPETGVVVGAADATDARADHPEMLVWAATLAAEHRDRGHVRVGIGTATSMRALPRLAARRKLESLGTAVRLARLGPLGEVARALQPDPGSSRIASLRTLIADHRAALSAAGSTGAPA